MKITKYLLSLVIATGLFITVAFPSTSKAATPDVSNGNSTRTVTAKNDNYFYDPSQNADVAVSSYIWE
jgi:hypothetical protein